MIIIIINLFYKNNNYWRIVLFFILELFVETKFSIFIIYFYSEMKVLDKKNITSSKKVLQYLCCKYKTFAHFTENFVWTIF